MPGQFLTRLYKMVRTQKKRREKEKKKKRTTYILKKINLI